jgi:ribonuclease E
VRLRDLAGLIVIDFIDMEETRHQRQVEHKVKDAMRHDRARIQIGRISAFGLLEMSRQRLRPSLLEHSTETCPHCAGTGRIRSLESGALHALRAIEEEGVRRRAGEIVVSVPPNVALYLLNQKRHTLSEIEKRYGFSVTIEADDELHAADCEIERVRTRRDDRERPGPELARASYEEVSDEAPADEPEGAEDREAGERTDERGEREDGDRDGGRRRRRRRRRRTGRRDEDGESDRPQAMGSEDQPDDRAGHATNGAADDQHNGPHEDQRDDEPLGDAPGEGERGEERADDRGDGDGERGDRRRRRGRRGGRRRRRENGEGEVSDHGGDHGEAPVTAPPMPIEGNPVEHMQEGRMPVEHAPYDASPPVAAPVNVEAAPPPLAPPEPPVVAAAPQPEPPPPPPVPVIEAPPEKPKRGWWRR